MDKYQGNQCTIHWIEIYPVDSAIHLLNNWGQMYSIWRLVTKAPVVQTLDSAIQRINPYPADSIGETNCTIHWTEIYLALVVQILDSAIHRINHYPADTYW